MGIPFAAATATMGTRRARSFMQYAWRTDRLLTGVSVLMLLLLGGTLLGLLLDPRVITGQPAWLKPAKFAISISVYSLTLLWLLGYVRGHRRLVRLVSAVTALSLAAEMAIIALQAARGTTSHFNDRAALDEILFAVMGNLILLVWSMNLLAAVLLLRQRLPDAAFAWSLRLGLLLSLTGMLVAVPMAVIGSHSVGVADGGPGLPLVGWSTEGGDLRIGHFVGLHGLQLLPLLGWLLRRRPGLLAPGHRLALIWTAGLGHLALVLLLTWQALREQPLLAPDALTLTAFIAIILTTAVALGAIALHAHRWSHRHPHRNGAPQVTSPVGA